MKLLRSMCMAVVLVGCSEPSDSTVIRNPGSKDDAGASSTGTGGDAGHDAAPPGNMDAGGSSGADGDAAGPDMDATSPEPDAGDTDAAMPENPAGPVPCGEISWIAEAEGLRFGGQCEGASLRLLPVAKIGGIWYGGGKTGLCSVDAGRVVCSAGALGRLGIEVKDKTLRAFWESATAAQLESLGVEGSLTLPGATAVLSNGLQSWSQSGVLTLGNAPAAAALTTALAARGEDEVYRKGSELSWWHTFVGGGKLSFSAGALSAERLRTFTQVYKEGDALRARIISGAGEKIAVAKTERALSEWFQIEIGADLKAMLERYGRALPTRRTAHPSPVPAGWNSWYDLWDDVREEQVASSSGANNADLAKTMLTPLLPQRSEPTWIVVDDGWQKAWGTWETNTKFPSGLSGLAKAIETRGMRMGLWFAPLLVNANTDVAKQHPDWLVKDAVYAHPVHGDLRVLDVTHPDAALHLENVVKSFVAAGIGLIKADFLFAGMYEGGRKEPVTGMQAYARALAIIRRAAGEQTRLIAVGAPPLVTFEYADAWRVGNDIAFKPALFGRPQPAFSFIANQARQITSRWPFCLATLCDADPMLLRVLTREQVEVGAWVAAAAGGALFLSDDLTKLPEERRAWGLDAARVSLGLGGVPATPESFFPETAPAELVNMKDGLFTAVHDVPSIWRLPDGKRLAFNFKDAAKTIEGVEVPATSVRVLGP